MAGLAIYQRLKEPRGNSHVWRYRRIQEARGVKTASIQGPFYIRPTQANGAQPWVTLDAATFDQAKLERDRKEKGGAITAENGAGRMLIADAIANFLDLKKRKNSSTVENYTFILNEFLQQTSAKYIDQVDRKVLDGHVSFLESKGAAPKTINNKLMVVVFMLKEAGVASPSLHCFTLFAAAYSRNITYPFESYVTKGRFSPEGRPLPFFERQRVRVSSNL